MSAATITTIISAILTAVEAAIQAGKSVREALADSLEEAAEKIRDGRLGIDEAVDRAREDQTVLDGVKRPKKSNRSSKRKA